VVWKHIRNSLRTGVNEKNKTISLIGFRANSVRDLKYFHPVVEIWSLLQCNGSGFIRSHFFYPSYCDNGSLLALMRGARLREL